MSIKPIVSLYASAARPENWMKLYDSIKFNICTFEIIFVGPNSPKFQLPQEFTFIKSFTKPVQCAEIAARSAKGDFLLHCVDDLTFKDVNALDKLLDFYTKNINSNNELILSPKLMRNGKKFKDSNYKLYPEIENCPYVPISIFIKKTLYSSLGGYDLNFIATFADTDLAYRGISEKKAKIKFVETFVEENKNDAKGSTLFEDYMDSDLVLLQKLWFSNKKFLFNRTLRLDPFSKLNILTKTQGKKGRWGYANKYIEKIFTNQVFILIKIVIKRLNTLLKNH